MLPETLLIIAYNKHYHTAAQGQKPQWIKSIASLIGDFLLAKKIHNLQKNETYHRPNPDALLFPLNTKLLA